ncbi:hypothetical protein KAR91_63975 [Candidatus Pacearchaeota archaeon]|nr:hypothetical protein [Candidatus Pacearchaeota archaeon]
MAEKKVIVRKGSSILTHGKGIAHAGAVLSAKDFSSHEIFDDLYEKAVSGNTEKVKVLKDPEPPKEVEPVRVEESKPDKPESAKEPESEKESSESPKKKSGRSKGGAKRNK